MPVKSLRSSVFKWPDADTVDQAVRAWAEQVARTHEDVWRIGYFGSYARGNWGVGSDLDLVVIVDHSDQPFERRALSLDTLQLPVPADVLVYTRTEWDALAREKGRFFRTLAGETVWVYQRD